MTVRTTLVIVCRMKYHKTGLKFKTDTALERDINRVVVVAVIQSINGNAHGTQFSALKPERSTQQTSPYARHANGRVIKLDCRLMTVERREKKPVHTRIYNGKSCVTRTVLTEFSRVRTTCILSPVR